MKPFKPNAAAALALASCLILASACGGGGGGGSSSGGGGGGGGGGAPAGMIPLGSAAPAAGVYLEATTSRSLRYDPFSLRPGTKVQLGVYQYTSAGVRTALGATNWQIAGATTSQATLTSSGGLDALAVTSRPFSVSARVTVAGAPQTIVQEFMITNHTTTISGNVRDNNTGAGMPYVQVVMADSVGTVVAGAMTGDDGAFSVRVPSGVTRISLKRESIPTETHYRQFRYNSRDYAPDVATCSIRLTGITAGANNPLPHPMRVLVKDTGPPPPPPNCFGG